MTVPAMVNRNDLRVYFLESEAKNLRILPFALCLLIFFCGSPAMHTRL
jgi:hypothetical protein